MTKFSIISFFLTNIARDNLHVLDAVTLMYVSGNLVHFLNTETRGMAYLRYRVYY